MIAQQLSGVQLVSPILVGPVRAWFQSQGYPANAITDSGEVSPDTLFALLFDTITIKTAATPDIVINMKTETDPATKATLQVLKPAVILKGRAGTVSVAPYGMPDGISTIFKDAKARLILGGVAGAVGLGMILWLMLRK